MLEVFLLLAMQRRTRVWTFNVVLYVSWILPSLYSFIARIQNLVDDLASLHPPTSVYGSVQQCVLVSSEERGCGLDPHLIRPKWVMAVSEGSANREPRLALRLSNRPLKPPHPGRHLGHIHLCGAPRW
jgi:hypothetical protein